jgi:hypothetical protein
MKPYEQQGQTKRKKEGGKQRAINNQIENGEKAIKC